MGGNAETLPCARPGFEGLSRKFSFNPQLRRVLSLHLKEQASIVLLGHGTNNTSSRRNMAPKPSRSEETLLFAKNFIQHPKMLGASMPSSRFLIGRLLAKVDWTRARTVVEYGPGVGTITALILARMMPNARLVVFEMNEDFVRYLARTFPDPRLHVVHGSAESVQNEL